MAPRSSDKIGLVDHAGGLAAGHTDEDALVQPAEVGGCRLFLSPRTVEWHLTKVFGKLGIGSRKELRSALSDVSAAALPSSSER